MRHFICFILFIIFSNCYATSVFDPPATLALINEGKAEMQAYEQADTKSVEFLLKMYDRTNAANKAINGVVSTAGTLTNIVLESAIDSTALNKGSGNFPGLLVTRLIKKGATSAVNLTVQFFEEMGEKQSKTFLLGAINKTYERVPNLDIMTPEQQYRELLKTRKNEDEIIARTIDNPKDSAIMHTFMLRSTRSEVVQLAIQSKKHHEVEFKLTEQLQKEQLELKETTLESKRETIDQIKKYGNGIIQLTKKSVEIQNSILDAQKNMVNKVDVLVKQSTTQGVNIEHIKGNVSTIKNLMFSKLSLAEQEQQLKDGTMDDLFQSPDQKQAIEAKIIFERKMGDAFEVGNLAVTLAGQLGFGNTPLVKGISKGLATANAVKNLALSAMSNPPMGLMSGVVDLLGVFGGQVDPAAERHSEIMQSFQMLSDQIRAGNEAILKEVGKVIEMTEKIHQKLDQMDEKINTILSELDNINQHLYSIEKNLIIMEDIIVEGFFKDYLTCSTKFIPKIKKTNNYIDSAEKVLISHLVMALFFPLSSKLFHIFQKKFNLKKF